MILPPIGEAIAFGVIALALLSSALASVTVRRTFHSVMFLGVALVAAAALYVLLGSPLVGVIQVLVYVGGILTLFVFAVMFVAGDEKEDEAPVVPVRNTAWSILAAVFIAIGAAVVAFWFVGPVRGLAEGLLAPLTGQGTFTQFLGLVVALAWIGGCAVGGLIAWLGARHAITNWPFTRILGVAVAGAVFGLMAGITLLTAAWDTVGTDAAQTAANSLDRTGDTPGLVETLFGPQVVAFEVLGVLLTAVMIGALVIARPLTGMSDAERYGKVTAKLLAESQAASRVEVRK